VSNRKIWAIVPAAGTGQRMQAEIAKQYLMLNEKTILENTLDLLLANKQIQEIIVATAAEDKHWETLTCSSQQRIGTTVGGASRAESVYNGLVSLQERAHKQDWVLVHDAARPCLSSELLSSFIEQLQDDSVGGILAVRAKDTLKLANSSGSSIDKTLDRSQIWQAQTPQMFRYGLLLDALEHARNRIKAPALGESFEITDEASAVEQIGYQPKLIEGDARNLKVTTPEDLQLAQFLLS